MASLNAFGDAGLECADLIVAINGVRFGEDHGGRWWEYPSASAGGARPGMTGAVGTGGAGGGGAGEGGGGEIFQGSGAANNGDDGGGGPAAAPPGRGGGKENRGVPAVISAAGHGVPHLVRARSSLLELVFDELGWVRRSWSFFRGVDVKCVLVVLGGCFRMSCWEQVCMFPLQLMRVSTHTLKRRA